MRYIHATKASFIALVISTLAVIFIPGKGSSHEVELVLTISTFLFAILAGFFISRLNTRYNAVRELVADEDAHWLSLYKISILYGRSFSDKIKELIDKYYIVCYDFDVGKYYKPSAKYLSAVYDELNKIKKYRSEASFGEMIEELSAVEEDRNKSSVIALEKVTKGQWIILIVLVSIILFSIFYLKIPQLYSQVITVLLSTVLALVLFTIRDLQNLRLGGEMLVVESGQEVLESIGRLRYYNRKYLKNRSIKIPKQIKKYRLGLHEPGEKFNIKVIHKNQS